MIASAAWHCLAWGLSALQKLCGALGPQRALAGVPVRRSQNAASPGQPNSGPSFSAPPERRVWTEVPGVILALRRLVAVPPPNQA